MKSIPMKPIDQKWTDEQWQAIHAQGNHILVAAAAGSGKTAVLVERIIQKIASEESPIDADHLLVVTFTKAAASEMKSRIRQALEQELKKKPWSLHLRRQLMLLNRASISTLHSFCMEVIKRYSYLLDLDPAFRVADENEVKLLRQEVIDTLLEEEYAHNGEGSLFYQLVEWYSNDRSDVELQGLIQRLYDFAMSNPWPEFWLEEMAGMYKIEEDADFDSIPWVIEIKSELQLELSGVKALLVQALQLAKLPNGPTVYIEQLESEIKAIDNALRTCTDSWFDILPTIESVGFGRLKPVKKDEVDEVLKEQAVGYRNQAKDSFKKIKSTYLNSSPQKMIADLIYMAPLMQELVRLILHFAEQYRGAKQEKGIVDFADLEHYCLQILRHSDSTPTSILPSEQAMAYREYFAEILIDEYQDTNRVQESILTLIARSDELQRNLFMVGDVKQSIYRFRLTEPRLFLGKYQSYSLDGQGEGLRIDLAKNFRSRAEVLHGTNYIFKQIMRREAAEMDYDLEAELILGANDYPPHAETAIELLWIDQNIGGEDGLDSTVEENDQGSELEGELEGEIPLPTEESVEELEKAQLEARLIAHKIKEMMKLGYQVYDRGQRQMRPVQYRDIVILLRSTSVWAPLFIEEFRSLGIPAYAELAGGYFAATEIEVMLSLLRIIDNPYQDIPLAAVLRSPIIHLTADQLAKLRVDRAQLSYYEAVQGYFQDEPAVEDGELRSRLALFFQWLEEWRTEARQGELSALIWRIYRDTGYYDFVGGLPGGNQRQANLRSLFDRARQFEASSYRGLFRFLRFVEKMQERGDEMGTARALGEQEDVVRLMTIHKSKGLEFPVVFIAGLAKQFNKQDLRGSMLYHKELGFGSKYIDTELRISYPTLPQLAIKRRLLMELLAEEMRLLYVALTRAKEKCYLVGTVKNLSKQIVKWAEGLQEIEWQLPTHLLVKCQSYLDWIGLALIRHQDLKDLRDSIGASILFSEEIHQHPSRWKLTTFRPEQILAPKEAGEELHQEIWKSISEWLPIPHAPLNNDWIEHRLSWSYVHKEAASYLSKQSVSEMKRRSQFLAGLIEEQDFPSTNLERPKFLEKTGLTAAEKGTAMHMLMQQLPFNSILTRAELQDQINRMIERELLTSEQGASISLEQIERFYQSEIGRRMQNAKQILREVPFSYVLPCTEIYPEWQQPEEESILVQGIIDCLIEEENGWTLLDYKTDRTVGKSDAELAERYRIQVELYARAIEEICRIKLTQKLLYFFDGERMIEIL